MAYSLNPNDSLCYPGTTVLINKLNIRSQKQLSEAETLMVNAKTIEFELAPSPESMDFCYYKRIHRHLFRSLYDWAGAVRTVNLSKQHTQFCPAHEIDLLAENMFSRLKDMDFFLGLEKKAFISELADFCTSVNYLHPFREGNGRTQRVYFR